MLIISYWSLLRHIHLIKTILKPRHIKALGSRSTNVNIINFARNDREPETEASPEIRLIRTTIHKLSEFPNLFY